MKTRLHIPAIAVAIVISASGCASALPTFTGGSTTPASRGDVGLGGAARVPTGDLRSPDDPFGSGYIEAADAGGVVPVAYGRYGTEGDYDVGLMIAGTTLRLELRHETVIEEDSTRPTWVYGLAPYLGWIPSAEGQSGGGGRVGLDLPAAYAVDFGGIYDIWVGARAGVEYAWGDFELGGAMQGADAFGVRIGAMIGMALGFRRLHALLELTAAYEHWSGSHGALSLTRGGLVLIPAFAIRVRI